MKAAIALGQTASPSSSAGPSLATIDSVDQPVAQHSARRTMTLGDRLVRVLLVDDHATVRDGLRILLRTAPEIQVVGEASSGVAAIAAIARCEPNVVVMDLDMPGGDGTTATRAIAKLTHPPKVLILTTRTEEERLIPLLESGASGFLSKNTTEHEFVDAIRAVAAGSIYVRPAVRPRVTDPSPTAVSSSSLDEAREKLARLSDRERSVLCRIAEGYSGVEIGRMLGITPKTIDTYKNRIGQKLGFTHRTDYVRFALRLRLIDAGDGQSNTDAASSIRRQPGLVR